MCNISRVREHYGIAAWEPWDTCAIYKSALALYAFHILQCIKPQPVVKRSCIRRTAHAKLRENGRRLTLLSISLWELLNLFVFSKISFRLALFRCSIAFRSMLLLTDVVKLFEIMLLFSQSYCKESKISGTWILLVTLNNRNWNPDLFL